MGKPPADFTYVARADGSVAISWRGKVVRTLAGEAAERFVAAALDADGADQQLLMAKATGNFKRGNERR